MSESALAAKQPHFEESGAGDAGSAFLEALVYLCGRKRTIAKITAAALLAGIATALLLPARYTATTRIMPPHQTQSAATLFINQLATSTAGSLAAAAGGGLGLKDPNDIYLALLKSRPVVDALLKEFNLHSLYRERTMTDARKDLLDNTAFVSEKGGLIAISVTDKDRGRAAAIANAYTGQLRALTRTLAVTEAGQRRLFYEDQLKSAKEDLVAAEFAFQQVQQRRGLIQPDAQARAMIATLATLRAQVGAKQVQLQALRSYSTEQNPDVQLAENQLASLQNQVAALEAKGSIKQLPNLGLQDVPAAGMDYLRAEHEFQYRQTLFDLLTRQYDAARLDEAKEAAVIQVVEAAIPPERKSSPHRALIVLLFTLFGFLCALTYLFTGAFLRSSPSATHSLAQLRSALLSR